MVIVLSQHNYHYELNELSFSVKKQGNKWLILKTNIGFGKFDMQSNTQAFLTRF
jgi:hypothetical protein